MTTQDSYTTVKPRFARPLGPCMAGILLMMSATAWAEDAVTYASGGVGLNSQEELTARQGEFSLKLVFAEKGTGSYLANVAVTIGNAAGQPLIEAIADGPWFYAKLPAGAYRVTAIFEGVAQTVKVQVPETGLKELTLRWKPAAEIQ